MSAVTRRSRTRSSTSRSRLCPMRALVTIWKKTRKDLWLRRKESWSLKRGLSLRPIKPLKIGTYELKSRLIVGTGKYTDADQTRRAIEASGAVMVTVAVRRVNLDRTKESLLDAIDPKKYILLPNTAGCYTKEDALRIARLGRAAGLSNLVKLEVIGDERTLLPDTAALLEATKELV